jgi:hypothetical protein
MSPGRKHLWSLWVGHLLSVLAAFVALRLAAGGDYVRGFQEGYAVCAAINGIAFFVMGSLYSGLQYVLGLAWMGGAVLLAVTPESAALEYAFGLAACNLLNGVHLYRLAAPPPAPRAAGADGGTGSWHAPH